MIENKSFPASVPYEFEYNQWRPRFLDVVLKASCALGLVIFLLGRIITSITPIELTLSVIAYIVILAITFLSTRYSIKAGTLILVCYIFGLVTLTRFGPWSDAIVFFLASTVFTSILFDQTIDIWVFGINAATIAGMGILDVLNILNVTSSQVPIADLGSWITYITNYVLLSVALIWAINLLKREFNLIARKFQSSIKLLTSERTELEHKVEEHTSSLIKKTEQLRASSYIARQTAEIENLSSLLDTVVTLTADQFGFYHTGVFLINETGNAAILQASSSEGGKRMMEKGYSLPIGNQNIIGYVAAHKTYRIAVDVGTDAVVFDNPDIPDTHSEIALPLIIRNRILGVLDIQSDQVQAFNMDDVDVLQTLADQVAVAIENARLLDESRTALLQLEAVTAFRTREAWRQKIQKHALTFTYTPLGLRAEAPEEESDNTVEVPITLRGQRIGSISIARKNNEGMSKLDEELIREVAYQVGLAADNIRLLEEATQRAQQEKTIGELAARFSQALDIDSLLQTAARELGQVSDVSEVSIFVGQLPEQSSQRRYRKRNAIG